MKLTDNQQKVLDSLRAVRVASSAYDLLARLEGTSLRAPTQVYRALGRLESEGLVHRVESLNAYVPCRSEGNGHDLGAIGFAVCTSCGHVDELDLAGVAETVRSRAAEQSFAVDSTAIEMRGRCADCAAA